MAALHPSVSESPLFDPPPPPGSCPRRCPHDQHRVHTVTSFVKQKAVDAPAARGWRISTTRSDSRVRSTSRVSEAQRVNWRDRHRSATTHPPTGAHVLLGRPRNAPSSASHRLPPSTQFVSIGRGAASYALAALERRVFQGPFRWVVNPPPPQQSRLSVWRAAALGGDSFGAASGFTSGLSSTYHQPTCAGPPRFTERRAGTDPTKSGSSYRPVRREGLALCSCVPRWAVGLAQYALLIRRRAHPAQPQPVCWSPPYLLSVTLSRAAPLPPHRTVPSAGWPTPGVVPLPDGPLWVHETSAAAATAASPQPTAGGPSRQPAGHVRSLVLHLRGAGRATSLGRACLRGGVPQSLIRRPRLVLP